MIPANPLPIMSPVVGTYTLRDARGNAQIVSTRSSIGDAAKSAWDHALAVVVPGGSIISPAADAIGRAAKDTGAAVTDLAMAATSGTRSAFFWASFLILALLGLWALSTARNVARGS